MAIEHLVVMKLREVLPEQELHALCRECEAQFEKIPGIVSVSMGANLRPGNPGFTHALLIRFEGRNALDVFMTHPTHVAVGKKMLLVFCDFLIVDYETERD